jgi:hypothetical protein
VVAIRKRNIQKTATIAAITLVRRSSIRNPRRRLSVKYGLML